MNRVCSVLLVMVVLLSGCSLFEKNDDGIQGDEVVVNQPNLEVLAEKLQVPWSIDKANQAFYISERTGTIVKIENGKTVRQPDYLYFVSNNTDGRGNPDEKDDKLYRVLLRDL